MCSAKLNCSDIKVLGTSPPPQKIGIIAKAHREKAHSVVLQLYNWLHRKELEIYFDPDTGAILAEENLNLLDKSKIPKAVDLLIVLGGDGTLLGISRNLEGSEVPILGVNLGGLGFLTETSLEELFENLEKILCGQYSTSPRMMLEVNIHLKDQNEMLFTLLNDLVINKGSVARMININILIEDRFVTNVKADGLIISTPTGSTAYSLAAGGPIVYPTMEAFILTPICPHMLTNRPLVISAESNVMIELGSKADEDVAITLDGQIAYKFHYGDYITIKKSAHKLNLILVSDRTYFDVLRTKLKWSER